MRDIGIRRNPQVQAGGRRAHVRGQAAVLTVKPGDIVETETFSKPGDYYEPKAPGPWPGEVGPFRIEGAAPGDTLVVRILKLTPNRDVAISNVVRTASAAWPATAARGC